MNFIHKFGSSFLLLFHKETLYCNRTQSHIFQFQNSFVRMGFVNKFLSEIWYWRKCWSSFTVNKYHFVLQLKPIFYKNNAKSPILLQNLHDSAPYFRQTSTKYVTESCKWKNRRLNIFVIKMCFIHLTLVVFIVLPLTYMYIHVFNFLTFYTMYIIFYRMMHF